MSTKLYNGYRLERVRTLAQLDHVIRPFREKARALLDQEYLKVVAQRVTEIVDILAVHPERRGELLKDNRHPLTFAWREVDERRRKIEKTGMRDPVCDFECEICILVSGHFTLALLYTEREAVRKLWEKQPKVKPYPYWNNTDRPEDVSTQEWSRRRAVWDRALPGVGVPATNGYTTSVVGKYGNPSPMTSTILPLIPDLASRVAFRAQEEAVERRLNGRSGRPDQMYRMASEATHWLREDAEGIAFLKTVTDEVRAKLKPELTKEDLLEDTR